MGILTKGVVIQSFEQLEEGLREWTSFGDPRAYDVGGMITLLCACIANLRKHALPGELEWLAAALTDEERSILQKLAASR